MGGGGQRSVSIATDGAPDIAKLAMAAMKGCGERGAATWGAAEAPAGSTTLVPPPVAAETVKVEVV
jgi:hypothetical protein